MFEGMALMDVAQIIATIGFPAFVAIWLLWIGKKQMEQFRDALKDLTLEVQITRKFIEHLVEKDNKKEDK